MTSSEDSFGHAIIRIAANGKNLVWEWHRNQDTVDVVTDTVTIVRDVAACPTRGASTPLISWERGLAGKQHVRVHCRSVACSHTLWYPNAQCFAPGACQRPSACCIAMGRKNG